MNAATIDRIESNTERAAAAFLACAVAFAIFTFVRGVLPPLEVKGLAALAAVGAFILCSRAMAVAAGAAQPLQVPTFQVRELEPFESDELLLTEADLAVGELLLTEADRLRNELLLTDTDRVQQSGDSRVVQLFDRAAMMTPRELKSRVDDHLAQASARPAPSDASQALAAALAELRRSLR